MPDSLAASSWIYVSPDTYRYFFSASAQVFAAIFAVVAIAYGFMISEIYRGFADFNLKRSQIIKFVQNYYYKKDPQSIQIQEIAILDYSDAFPGHVLNKISDLIQSINDEFTNNSEDKAMFNLASRVITELKRSNDSLHAEKSKIRRKILISASLCVIGILSSMTILWLEMYQAGWVWTFGIVYFIILCYNAWLFIQAFKDRSTWKETK